MYSTGSYYLVISEAWLDHQQKELAEKNEQINEPEPEIISGIQTDLDTTAVWVGCRESLMNIIRCSNENLY